MIKSALRAALQRLGLIGPDRSPAGQFPLYRTLDRADRRTDAGSKGRLVFVLPPVSRGSGGIADILHLGETLHRKGAFDVRYLLPENQPAAEARANLHWAGLGVSDERIHDQLGEPPEFLCATAWPTVYRALELPARQKLYFVQDYEPDFYPAGVARFYADHTYNLGWPMITLGPWLQHALKNQGRPSRIASIPFPYEPAPAPTGLSAGRSLIAMYLQPDKHHRGSELLVETARALSPQLTKIDPTLRLAVFGSRINDYIVFDFPCDAHGVLDGAAMADLLARARIGVCASFTNISLMPFRFLAAGAPFVDLDQPSVRMNLTPVCAPVSRLAAPSAEALAQAVTTLLESYPAREQIANAAARLSDSNGWNACASAFQAFAAECAEESGCAVRVKMP